MAMRWRHLLRVIHRDLGYCAVALTIAYALSGLAVNHIDDWNPNYTFDQRAVELGPLPVGELGERASEAARRLGVDRKRVRGHVADSATQLRVFFDDGSELELDMPSGRGTHKQVAKRAVLFEVNTLHLNNLKGVWTYVADLFAIALAILALSGMLMMKGDRGLAGRGKYFVLGGLAIPLGAIVYLYW